MSIAQILIYNTSVWENNIDIAFNMYKTAGDLRCQHATMVGITTDYVNLKNLKMVETTYSKQFVTNQC